MGGRRREVGVVHVGRRNRRRRRRRGTSTRRPLKVVGGRRRSTARMGAMGREGGRSRRAAGVRVVRGVVGRVGGHDV